MANKTQEFGIVRNGEHLERGFTSKEECHKRLFELQTEDDKMVKSGWITSTASIHYWIEEIKSRAW